MPDALINLHDLTREDLRLLVVRWGFPAVHAARIWSHLHLDLVTELGAMAEVDKARAGSATSFDMQKVYIMADEAR